MLLDTLCCVKNDDLLECVSSLEVGMNEHQDGKIFSISPLGGPLMMNCQLARVLSSNQK